ncbi:hypothetical protein ACFOWX_09875 [Sphingorhabdus arenilitoris]|uniref:DUF11 domain-containing protein n=1 Tax=Sphingorhabdus arenilitoris TaxID=1490041 RepID=A0ABV8RJQ5_9SPHN
MLRRHPLRAVCVLLLTVLFALPFVPASADLRAPGWWDPDGIAAGSDWHYRVPVTLPANASVNSTAKVNVDFASLMTQLGISGSFDVNSVRVVRPGGSLVTVQEYTDTLFNDATDATGNNRGEVKWIVQDGGAQTYYIYFDITQNGAKPVNPQSPINANFERATTGQASPTGWTGSAVAGYDAQARPNETVTVSDQTTVATNGNANSGSFSYLLGARSAVDGNGADRATLTRTFTVPATNPGNITVRWKPQGWDSAANGATQYDFIRIDIVGTSTSELVGPTAGNYATRPFSPNFRVGAQSATQSGYGPYNGWDNTSTGTHTQGMTVAQGSEPWWTYSQSLAGFEGQTVTLRFRTTHVATFRSWFLVDDIEWSVVNGTLGIAEAYGVAGTIAASVAPGEILSVSASVDANPTAATLPVTASILNNSGAVVASGIRLYNDGTHGDAVAGDAIWTNNGTDPANPTYTIPLATPASSGWTLRIFAKDASSSTSGAANNGLVRRNGAPTAQTEANYWNIDDRNFDVAGASLSTTKISQVLSDGVSAANPKAVPGALVRYCITIFNSGPSAATSISLTDAIPANLTYVAGSMASGASCGAASTAEDDNATGTDESDPIGASFSGSAITATNTTLASGASMALTFNVTVN